jgi:RNA polymerase sigma-70 factor, ECF subfamily
MSLSENTAIQALKKGNHIGMNTLVLLYQDLVYCIIYKILKNEDDSLEATQDTFLKAYRSIDKFDEDQSFKSWICKIAYRTALDYYRKSKSILNNQEVYLSAQDSDQFIEPTGQMLEKSEIKNWVIKNLELLEPEDNALIQLYYFKELSISEITKIVDLSETNIKTKLYRIRKKLYEMMVNELNHYQS